MPTGQYKGADKPRPEQIELWRGKVGEVVLERYESAEAVYRHYSEGIGGIGIGEGAEIFAEDPTDNPEAVGYSDEDVIEGIEKVGLWGFCDTFSDPPVIHYWRSATVETALFLEFLGHELSHAVIEKALVAFRYHPNDELLAEVVAAVTGRAFRVAMGWAEPEPGFTEQAKENE